MHLDINLFLFLVHCQFAISSKDDYNTNDEFEETCGDEEDTIQLQIRFCYLTRKIMSHLFLRTLSPFSFLVIFLAVANSQGVVGLCCAMIY
jgi:hypothetical protein